MKLLLPGSLLLTVLAGCKSNPTPTPDPYTTYAKEILGIWQEDSTWQTTGASTRKDNVHTYGPGDITEEYQPTEIISRASGIAFARTAYTLTSNVLHLDYGGSAVKDRTVQVLTLHRLVINFPSVSGGNVMITSAYSR